MPTWLRPCVDAAMTLVYVMQMAPGKMGNAVHEVAGIAFAALFVVHHVLNRGWMGRLGRRRDLRSRITLASDVLLSVFVAGTVVSGVLMSRSAVPWLSVPTVAHLVRPLHGACAYLGLMTCAFHVGLHVRVLAAYAGRRGRRDVPAKKRAAAPAAPVPAEKRAVAPAASVPAEKRAVAPAAPVPWRTVGLGVASLALGAWAFVRLGVAVKLAGQPSFPDAVTPLGAQILLNLALTAPFVFAGSLASRQVFVKKG